MFEFAMLIMEALVLTLLLYGLKKIKRNKKKRKVEKNFISFFDKKYSSVIFS